MKKGQGQMVAFVLLVGFTVVIGIMVGNWAVQRARKSTQSIVDVGERDARCADVGIAQVCLGLRIKVRNMGVFKVKLKSGNQPVNNGEWIFPNQESTSSQGLNSGITVIPFIEIEGREVGCSSKAITLQACI